MKKQRKPLELRTEHGKEYGRYVHTSTLGLKLSLSQSTQHVPGASLKGSSAGFVETISSPSNAATLLTNFVSGFCGSFNITTSPTNTDLQSSITSLED